jgi:hypothetical protein
LLGSSGYGFSLPGHLWFTTSPEIASPAFSGLIGVTHRRIELQNPSFSDLPLTRSAAFFQACVCGIGRRREEEKRKREGKGSCNRKGKRRKKRRKEKMRGGGIRSKGFAPFGFFFLFLFSFFSKDEGRDKDISLGQSQADMWHKDLSFYFKHYTFYKLLQYLILF